MKSIKYLLPCFCILLVFSVGCHKKNKQGTNNGTPKLTDPEIASVAVAANQIDINHAKIALKKSKNINVRMFATNMITDHKAIINAASALVKKLGVTPKNNKVTKSLKKNAKKVTKMLKSKNGKAFNKAYINNEIKYHSAVISDVKNVLVPQAKNKQLKDLLIRAEPVFKEHLHHAKNVQNELSSSGSGNNSNSNNKAGGSSY